MIYAYFGPDANVIEGLRRSFKISIDMQNTSLFPEVEKGTYRPVLIDQLSYVKKVGKLLTDGDLLIMTCHPIFPNLVTYLITKNYFKSEDIKLFYVRADGSTAKIELDSDGILLEGLPDLPIWEAGCDLIFEVPDMV